MKIGVQTLDLADPKDARTYIDEFRVKGRPVTYVELSSGKRIDVDRMTDKEAVTVAHLLYEMELEAERSAAEKAGKIQ
jgi:hypothetical protein